MSAVFRQLMFPSLMALAPGLLPIARAAPPNAGQEIYQKHCAECHGPHGEGVADKYDEPLSGDRSIASLARLIDRTMPEDKPETLDAAESAQVAEYIYQAFYSPAARDRVRPAKIAFSRLTVRQHRQSLTDLIGSFRHREPITETGGLKGRYTSPDPKVPEETAKKASDKKKRPKKTIERQDAMIKFEFGGDSPMGEELEAQQFNIEWNGSVYAEETGSYEFILRTENGARLWLNNEQDKKLIDGWVSSGSMTEHKGAVFLLGGRFYPIKLQFFKFKDKSASISLEWQPPHRPREVIPARYLSPRGSKELFVATTAFPPDDASAGYERGISVSKDWDEAATQAAIEAAEFIVSRLDQLAHTNRDDGEREAKAKAFLRQLAERAFRRPLSDDEARLFIDARFAGAASLENAVRQAVLLILKSPRFLYPELGPKDDWTVAARMALIMWDSLPNEDLQRPAERGELHARDQVQERAKRMLHDPRTKAKLHAFFHHWLHLDKADDLAKDEAAHPGFNEHVAADLATSLQLFIDDIVWSDASDYRQLLTADYLFLNARLARFYGADLSGEGEFRKVVLDAEQRAGLMTHPLLLSAFSYYKSSSPIHRGVFITRNVLGRSLKPPVTAIEFVDDKFDPSLTMREKVTELTKSESCMACHGTINALGFSLEHFDAVGRLRELDNQKPVNAVSDYLTADGDTLRLTGPRDVAQHAVNDKAAQRGFIEQLFHALVKQPITAYGAGTLDDLHSRFVKRGFNIQQLVIDITTAAALHGIEQEPPT